MQLRRFYAHANFKYKNVNAEPITIRDRDLLLYAKNSSPQPGQKRFIFVTTLLSFEDHIRKVLDGP